MGWQPWGDIGSFLQGVAGLFMMGSLFFIVGQYREMVKQNTLAAGVAVGSAYTSLSEATIDLDRFFVENPVLIPYFYYNAAIDETDPEYGRVMCAAEMIVDYWDLVWVLRQTMPPEVTRLPWKGWKDYFAARYKTSPALRIYWAENRQFYSHTLDDILGNLPNQYLE